MTDVAPPPAFPAGGGGRVRMADSFLFPVCLQESTILNGPISLPLQKQLSSALNQPSWEVTCDSLGV